MADSSPFHSQTTASLRAFEAAEREILSIAAEEGGRLGIPVYLVGGAVRDLLLGRGVRDLDLTVEGAAERVARAIAKRLEGEVESHPGFGTATVRLPAHSPIDIATCRRERYEAPGALPKVRPASIAQDLARRDFTINALALRLDGGEAAVWLDPHGGRDDLERGLLRVLHASSFLDDPTRVLRGIRLAVRLGFDFEAETEELARAALRGGAFTTVSGERLSAELLPTLALGEAAVAHCDRLGGLEALDPDLAGRAGQGRLAREVRELAEAYGAPDVGWAVLLALGWELERPARERVARRLALAGKAGKSWTASRAPIEAALALTEHSGARPHAVAERLEGLSSEELALLGALGGPAARRWIDRYLKELRALKLGITGADLEALGVARGPEIGRLLREVREARLDGEIAAAQELEYARRRWGRAEEVR